MAQTSKYARTDTYYIFTFISYAGGMNPVHLALEDYENFFQENK